MTNSNSMKVGEKLIYKTKASNTWSIVKLEENRFEIGGFDECSSLEEAKRTLEWIDSSDNRY